MIPDDIIAKAQILYNQAIALGYSHASAIGVCANVMAESSFNEGASEVGGIGFGYGQWTPPENLYIQGSMLGYSRSECQTKEVQGDILLRGDETGQWSVVAYTGYDPLVVSPQTLNQYKSESDINSATMNYMAHWERPSEDPNTNHKEQRKAYAREFDEKLDGNGGEQICYTKPIKDTNIDRSSFMQGQLFGHTRPGWEGGDFHNGLDFGSIDHPGSEMLAICDGTITHVGFMGALRAYFVMNNGTYNIVYQEFSYNVRNIKVKVGDTVKTNQVLAIRDADHLHLGFTKKDFMEALGSSFTDNGTWEDPLNFLGKCFGGGGVKPPEKKKSRRYTLQNIKGVFRYDYNI